MSQPGYVLSVLRRFQMHDSQPLGTPVIPVFFAALAKETCTGDQVGDLEQYQAMIGCLLYLGRRTRPDTLAPVRILTRFCNSPSSYCHKAAKRILRYLRGARSHKIQCVAGSLDLNVLVNSDHAADTVTRRSMTGVVIRLGDVVYLLGCKTPALG
jgi:hypothetical protein